MAHNVKQVTVTDNMFNLESSCKLYNSTVHKRLSANEKVHFPEIDSHSKGANNEKLFFDYLCYEETKR